MSRTQRFALLALAVVVAAVAFVIARPGDDDEPANEPAARTTQQPTGTTEAPEPPKPRVEEVRVEGGQPVGGVKKVTFKKGDRIRLAVSSPDTSDEVHVHGYNLTKDLAPGRPVRFQFPATIEGVFEIELEGAHVQIMQLTVEPS
jgi:hypothetical protein